MPSLDDEKATYTRWGWTWTASQEPYLPTPYLTQPTRVYSVVEPDIHGSTEGDDLWTYLTMYQRTGQPGYLERARAWARYFKDDYRQCVGERFYSYCRDGSGFGYDHMYGTGLIAWYEFLRDQGDPTAGEYLEAAKNLGTDLETFYSDPKYVPGTFLAATRATGRHLLLLSRLYEVTGHAQWRTLLDKLVNLLLTSTAWNPTYGTYFVGRNTTDQDFGAGAYDSGLRILSSWMTGILSEGLGAAYRVTGNAELRTRMVQIARFFAQYGPHPTDGYYGYLFGLNINTGTRVWAETWNVTTPPKWTGAYSTAVTNLLVRGYQYSGDATLLHAAQRAFACGTHKGFQREGACPSTFTTVGHFLDVQFDSSSQGFYLAQNKGELFYSHLIFINGGNPPVLP